MFKFALALLISSSLATETVNFDLGQINIALRLSMDAYCGVDEYATHVFASYSEGFVVTKALHNILVSTMCKVLSAFCPQISLFRFHTEAQSHFLTGSQILTRSKVNTRHSQKVKHTCTKASTRLY